MSTEATILSTLPAVMQAQLKKEVLEEIEKEKRKKENEVSPAMIEYLERKEKNKIK